ncbi:MAG: PASTA domain-containing protein [Coriobacteriales bacterium]|jgi:serine/threonine-protein kinase|nr:PASTA domain-containing protein [Coriobacteriales bacterium]
MSDFLSQFENGAEIKPVVAQPARQQTGQGQVGAGLELRPGAGREPGAGLKQGAGLAIEPPVAQPTGQQAETAFVPASALNARGIKAVEHRIEVDTGYKRARLRRRLIIAGIVVAVLVAAGLIWHFSRLVEVPDFVDKPLAEAQSFSQKNEIELELSEEFRLDVDAGVIVSQGIAAGETLTRGSKLPLSVSKGPNPDELLTLPDFATMKRGAAELWIAEMRANNLRIVIENSETVPADEFLRIEFRAENGSATTYRRKDYATLYYSKGPEVFEKNIVVPDFAQKMQGEVESWAQTNGIKLEIEESDSDTIPEGGILKQSVAAGERLAKNDTLGITVSLGKALIVPNFANYTAQTAAGAAGELPVTVETRYSADVSYGRLMWQSIASGTRLLPKEIKPITVVYSEGRPYLKDYRGTSEGDLAATFFNDYGSKGANVSYDLRYVDSYEPKGQVVGMSDYSTFIPLDFHVTIDISRGNLTPPPSVDPPQPTTPTP